MNSLENSCVGCERIKQLKEKQKKKFRRVLLFSLLWLFSMVAVGGGLDYRICLIIGIPSGILSSFRITLKNEKIEYSCERRRVLGCQK